MIRFRSRILAILLSLIIVGCENNSASPGKAIRPIRIDGLSIASTGKTAALPLPTVKVEYDVPLSHFYAFIDSLLLIHDSVAGMAITEHVLIRANSWIIDTLRTTDYYYRLEERGEFVENPNALIVLHSGQEITIPDSTLVARLYQKMRQTRIDVNIPEFKLRIWENDKLLHHFNVRVGKHDESFLKMAGRVINLETPVGSGEIVRINKNPWFINPKDNKRYYKTRRDDKRYTELPLIPWIEPTINDERPGSLIHPTTNKSTLKKAVSNGCVGLSEGDMWVVYYYAPLGTQVDFRYDLHILDFLGDTLHLEDIYEKELQIKN